MRGEDSAEPSAAVRAAAGDALLSLAVDVPSTVVSSTRTTLGVASARGDSPREYDPSLEVDYECESDEMADSGRMEQSPDTRQAADYEPSNETAHSDRRVNSLFGSDDEDDPSSPVRSFVRSPIRSPARVSVQGDDGGVSHRKKSPRGTPTSAGTTQGSDDSKMSNLAPEKKPWLLPERLINSLSGETTPHNKYPLFIATKLHGLDPSAKNFRAEEDFYLDAFLKHRWFSGNNKRDKVSLMQAWSAFIRNVKDIGREAWLQKLNANRVKFEKRTPTGAKYKLHRLSREAGLPCLTWGDPCPCCVDNSKRVKGDVYSLSSPWGRARISIEMRDAIDVLQSIYKRQGRVFSDGPSEPSGGSRHTDGRGPQRQQSAGNEVPSCHAKVDNLASEQDNSFAAPSHHGGSGYVPQGNVDHRGSPPKVVVEEGKLDPNRMSDLMSKIDKMDHFLHDLEEGLEHERGKRRSLEQMVQNHHIERLEDRSKGAYSLLEYERNYHAVRDELSSAHRSFEDLRNKHEKLQVQHENLVRDHKNLLGILEKGGHIRPRKKPRTDGTGGADQRKT